MDIAGIIRDRAFSPNSNDRSIMEAVSANLQREGHAVTLYEESQFVNSDICQKVIFTMARGNDSLSKLKEYEQRGAIVVNPTNGIEFCQHMKLIQQMNCGEINIPPSIVVDISQGIVPLDKVAFPCWIKNAESFTQVKDDVCFVANEEELHEKLLLFTQRGIKNVLISKHVEGDILKFYGVAGSSFFYWYYPTLQGKYGKFGLEKHNGSVQQYAFSVLELKNFANNFALKNSLYVYGGDCVVDSSGRCWLIDFNDWPSFSPCIDRASVAIASLILDKANGK